MNEKDFLTSLDFSGINVFWKIMGKLEREEYPTEAEWKELFATPGYRTLLKQEFSPEFFKEKFILAFMPSKGDDRENTTKTERDTLYLPHYVRVRNSRELIVKFLNSLDSSQLLKKAVQAAFSLLPHNSGFNKASVPKVAFVIFKNDARGGCDPIVMDALASMEWGDLSLFLGHEFHHYFRNKLPFALNFLTSDTIEACLINTIISIETEGIADLINMDQLSPVEAWIQRQNRYKLLLDLVPNSIRYLDEWVVHNFSRFSNVDQEECNALSTEISDSGHQMGYFMAKAIMRHFFKKRLIATVGKPFAFFNLYQDAANRDRDLPLLSETFQKILLNLEKKYMIN